MTHTCQQVVFTGPGEIALQERQLPVLQPDEVRIRTRTTLISPGTERAFFLGLPNTTKVYPQTTGYSNIGEVIAAGDRVLDRPAGMRVASPSHHASVVQTPAAETCPLPDTLATRVRGDETASFFNLVSIALQGVRKARIEIGESVAVIGAGLIGLLAAQLAHVNGAMPVTVIDREATRLEFARALGLNAVPAAQAQDDQPVPPPAVVVEATGHPDAVNAALGLAAPHGRVILLGSTRGVTGEVNFYRDVHRKGLHIVGAHDITRPSLESRAGYWTQSADREVALQLLAAGRITVAPLITHRFDWTHAESAYHLLRNWNAGALGIVLNW